MKEIGNSIYMSRKQFIKSTILYCTAALVFPTASASGSFMVFVDINKCIGCEKCVEVCPVELFEMHDGKASLVNADECIGCGSCVEVCEPEAISLDELNGQRG